MRNRFLVFRNISCIVTNSGVPETGGIRPEEKHLGLISNGAIVYSDKSGILWVGKNKSVPRSYLKKPWRSVNCSGLVAYPGLVDPHTHLAFAGDRSREFELRMRGASYSEIAAAGGGILSSMKNTRKASLKELTGLVRKRLDNSFNFGVRLLEAKSGYGLNFESELRSLQAIDLGSSGHEIQVVRTCLSAHAIPLEYKDNRAKYIQEILTRILPAVKKKRLAEYVDVFCDSGFYTIEETNEIFSEASRLGFSLRVHGEELAETGVAALAAKLGAHSVDHLLKVSDRGISEMARMGTVGILLPGTSFYLREPSAPARKLIDGGVPVALATDFNPGTCPTQNLPFIGTLAAIQLGMSTAEIIVGLTWNGARSLRREKEFGVLSPGFKGLPAFCSGDHPSSMFYLMAQGELVNPTKLK